MRYNDDDFLFRAFAGGAQDPDPQTVRAEPAVDPGTTPGKPARPPARGKKNAPLENLEALGTTKVPQVTQNIHLLSIVGQVEGHLTLPPQNKTTKYEHIIPQLVAVEQNPEIEGLLIVLNTVGGDVEAGLAIAEMVSSLSKPSVSLVLGGGHSIGVPIAVSTTHSFIASTATMTIHPIRLTGLVIGVPLHTKMHRVRMSYKSVFASSLNRPFRRSGGSLKAIRIGLGSERWKRRRGARSARWSMSCA